MTAHTRPGPVPETGLAYNLDDLVQAAAHRHGLSAARTLAIADELFELGLITCPRTDERRLLSEQFVDASKMVSDYLWMKRQAAKTLAPVGISALSAGYDPGFRGPVWIDELPRQQGITVTNVSAAARFATWTTVHQTMVYGLIHERFLAMFRSAAPYANESA